MPSLGRMARRLSLAAALCSLLLTMVAAPVAAAPAAAMPSDFNGDGYADLAIGVQARTSDPSSTRARSTSSTGRPNGPAAGGDQFWSQDSPGVKGTSQGGRTAGIGNGDYFGAALASGDFDKDGYADLAIGVPSDRVGHDNVRGGAVNILYGSKSGLTATGDQLWSLANLPGVPVKHDCSATRWRRATSTATASGTSRSARRAGTSAVSGMPGEVRVLYGGPRALRRRGHLTLTRSSVPGKPRPDDDGFGAALAAGDVTGDGRAELAVGVPFGTFSVPGWRRPVPRRFRRRSRSPVPSGGRSRAPGSTTWWTWATGSGPPLPSATSTTTVIATSPIGTPNIETRTTFGKVIVLPGTVAGLPTSGRQIWDSPVEGTDDWGPVFGFALAAGDFDGERRTTTSRSARP